jgi:glycosyltransferase involved in cell wall biosynthesis
VFRRSTYEEKPDRSEVRETSLELCVRTPYRVAVVSTHPIQYQAHWFRSLAARPALKIHVYYCHRASPQEQAHAGFGVAFDWDLPLLDGYPHTFLENVARPPGPGRFAGYDTPEIKNVIRGGHYDAVLINGWHYKSAWQAIWACRKSGVKVLVWSDSNLHSNRSIPKRMAKGLLYRSFIPRFDGCLSVGKWSREYFLYYGARPERVFFVPHSVDTDRITAASHRLEPRRAQLRRQWGLDEKDSVFLFAGKFIDKKRPMDFVRAITQAKCQGAAVQGLMVGDGPLRESCGHFVREHNSPIRFTGFLNQSQIVAAYVASDLLVLPSDGGETWGLVVNEAMTCGRPCIVSDYVGCGPDLIEIGKTGAIFPMGDVNALTGFVTDLAREPSRVAFMGAQSRYLIQKYSTEAAVEGMLHCLTSITQTPV